MGTGGAAVTQYHTRVAPVQDQTNLQLLDKVCSLPHFDSFSSQAICLGFQKDLSKNEVFKRL